MTHQTTKPPSYIEATKGALATLDTCYQIMSELVLPQNERIRVGATLMYASIEQARSACLLVLNDPAHSTFAAFILLRSQLDQMMRGMFFAGPASDEQLAYYLDTDEMPKVGKVKAHPALLSELNDAHYSWTPKGRITSLVKNHWEVLCGMTHGGHALLNFYISEDGIGPIPPNDELIEVVGNAVALSCVTIQVVGGLASNKSDPEFQDKANTWAENALVYLHKWIPKPDQTGDEE